MVRRALWGPWAVAICLVAGVTAPASGAEPTVAAWADEFVDSIGVNVHWGDDGGAYNRHYDALKARLAEAGIRHLRDGALPNAYRRGTELYNDLGVRTTLIHAVRTGEHSDGRPEYKSPLVPAGIAASLAGLRDGMPAAAVAAVEGPNEYDLFHDDRDPDWAGNLRAYQAGLYRAVKADAALGRVPVVGPSLTSHQAFEKVGDLSAAMDLGCGHFYRSTRPPGSAGWGDRFNFPPHGGGNYGSMGYNIAAARLVCGDRPLWSTEAGYPTHTDGVSETVQAKYAPRLFAEFFRLGVRRTHWYELLDQRDDRKDEQMNFGLLRHDATEKPAFVALKSLIGLLKDNAWDASGKRWTAGGHKPASLEFKLTGATANVRSLLLQKRDGAFYLLLWQEVADPKFHNETWQPKYERDARVTLTVATPVRSAAVFALDPLGRLGEKAARFENGAVTVDVPDRIVVVRLTPAGGLKP